MRNLLKKSFLVGVGAISITRDKAEKLARELEEKGEVTSDEAKQFADDLVERGEQERNNIKETVKREMNNLRHVIGAVTQEQFAELENRVKIIESRISNMGAVKESVVDPELPHLTGQDDPE